MGVAENDRKWANMTSELENLFIEGKQQQSCKDDIMVINKLTSAEFA